MLFNCDPDRLHKANQALHLLDTDEYSVFRKARHATLSFYPL